MSAAHPLHALYSHHHGWLQSWLRRRLGCADDAADLAQDTFVRVLTARGVEQVAEPRAFLTTLAKRVLSSHWRRHALEQAYLQALAELPPVLAPSPEDQALLQEALRAIDQALDGLPVKVKQAFLLHRLDGMTHVQIAAEMGVSLASVERYVKQAYLHCCLQAAGADGR